MISASIAGKIKSSVADESIFWRRKYSRVPSKTIKQSQQRNVHGEKTIAPIVMATIKTLVKERVINSDLFKGLAVFTYGG